MKKLALAVAAVLLLPSCGGVGVGSAASPVRTFQGQTVDVWVSNQQTGEPLPIFAHNSRFYLLAQQGVPYRIEVQSLVDRRLEIVISVDGRDVISGQPADFVSQRGYVIDPKERVLVNGFRQSLDEVAAFSFAVVAESYASQMGDATNVGVIGIAVFEEIAQIANAPVVSVAASREAEPESYESDSAGGAAIALSRKDPPSKSSSLGTGYGDSVSSKAEMVPFVRAQSELPVEVLALYYDEREGLTRLGIEIPSPSLEFPSSPPGPSPFPATEGQQEFAPAPP